MTLIELIIAIAIVGTIGAVVVSAVHQILVSSRQANDQQNAVNQLRQAEHYITRDVLMTWRISSSGFPLDLYWEAQDDEGNKLSYAVEYTMVGAAGSLRALQRTAIVTDLNTSVVVENSTMIVAGDLHVDSGCTFANPTLTVTLKTPRGTTPDAPLETRVFEVMPRKSTIQVT